MSPNIIWFPQMEGNAINLLIEEFVPWNKKRKIKNKDAFLS